MDLASPQKASLSGCHAKRGYSDPRSGGAKTGMSIVLDLDLTLVFVSDDMDLHQQVESMMWDPKSGNESSLRKNMFYFTLPESPIQVQDVKTQEIYTSVINEQPMWGIQRPHLTEFLDFCFTYFQHVIVWTAAIESYAQQIVRIIFPDPNRQPLIICHRDHCLIESESFQIVKPLWALFAADNCPPELNIESILVIDDRPHTFSMNSDNGIQIRGFLESELMHQSKSQVITTSRSLSRSSFVLRILLSEAEQDICLLQLIHWFQQPHIAQCTDIFQLEHEKQFIFSSSSTASAAGRSRPQVKIPKSIQYLISDVSKDVQFKSNDETLSRTQVGALPKVGSLLTMTTRLETITESELSETEKSAVVYDYSEVSISRGASFGDDEEDNSDSIDDITPDEEEELEFTFL